MNTLERPSEVSDYKVRKVSLDQIGRLVKYSQRNDLSRLSASAFRSIARYLRYDPESEIYALYDGQNLLLLITVFHSLFQNFSHFELIDFQQPAMNFNPELKDCLASFLHTESKGQTQIVSTLPLAGEQKPLQDGFLFAYHLSRELLNPEPLRRLYIAPFHIYCRFRRSDQKMTGLWVVHEDGTAPDFLAECSEGEGQEAIPNLILAEGETELSLALEKMRGILEDYLSGKSKKLEFEAALPADSSDFQKRVWSEISNIPYGETRTYEDIARAVVSDEDFSNYSRAVGQACTTNPLMLLIPCHRIVGSEGELRGYVTGVETQAALLDLEFSKRN